MAGEEKTKKGSGIVLKLLMVLVALLVIAGVYFAGMFHEGFMKKHEKVLIDGTFVSEITPVGNFALTDTNGQAFTQDSLKGHWNVIVFGYTNCGFVCPIMLANVNKVYSHLQQDIPTQLLPQVVFVSVDPNRDPQDILKTFVTAFNPNFLGARGSDDDIDTVAKAFGVTKSSMVSDTPAPAPAAQDANTAALPGDAKLGSGTASNYAINHSTDIVVVDGNGDIRAYFAYPQNSDNMVLDFKTLVNKIPATWNKPQDDNGAAATTAQPADAAPAPATQNTATQNN